ncbi:hypothetical protein GCM10009760_54690 [Kitasatospora kazusensis]|uniref:Uncharacterized protein n=1 Tax=Kitasatospora kazusensis TaxID=407974 RepID=A0ABP5LWX6_9ACTN
MTTEPSDDGVYGRPVETPQSRMAGEEVPPPPEGLSKSVVDGPEFTAPLPADAEKPPGVPEPPTEGRFRPPAERQVSEERGAVDTTVAEHEDEVPD